MRPCIFVCYINNCFTVPLNSWYKPDCLLLYILNRYFVVVEVRFSEKIYVLPTRPQLRLLMNSQRLGVWSDHVQRGWKLLRVLWKAVSSESRIVGKLSNRGWPPLVILGCNVSKKVSCELLGYRHRTLGCSQPFNIGQKNECVRQCIMIKIGIRFQKIERRKFG